MFARKRSVIQKKAFCVFQKNPGSRREVVVRRVAQPKPAEGARLQPAFYKAAGLPPQEEAGEDGDAQSVLHHGEDRELVDGEEADVRLDVELLQDPVNVAARRILCGDKGSACEFLHGNSAAVLQAVSLGKNGKKLVVHDRQELKMMPLLVAEESDVHPAFLDPVREVVLGASMTLKTIFGWLSLNFWMISGIQWMEQLKYVPIVMVPVGVPFSADISW